MEFDTGSGILSQLSYALTTDSFGNDLEEDFEDIDLLSSLRRGLGQGLDEYEDEYEDTNSSYGNSFYDSAYHESEIKNQSPFSSSPRTSSPRTSSPRQSFRNDYSNSPRTNENNNTPSHLSSSFFPFEEKDDQSRLPSSSPSKKRPTPYDVWKERQPESPTYSPSTFMREEDWHLFVNHLHEEKRRSETSVLKKQNDMLREEMDGVTFKPRFSKKSMQLSKNKPSFQTRLVQLTKKKEETIERKRRERREEEEKELTFQPTLSSRKTTEKILARTGNSRISCTQSQELVNLKEQRNLKRSKLIQDIEDREASFQPQINKKSLLINEELRRKGQVMKDEVTKLSNVTPNRNLRTNKRRSEREAEGSHRDPGHEEEVFTPRITRLAQKLTTRRHGKGLGKSGREKQRGREAMKAKVFDRLYTEAVEKGKLKKKERIALIQTFHKDVNLKLSDDPESTLNRSTSLTTSINRKMNKEKEYLDSMITTKKNTFVVVEIEDLNQKRHFFDVFTSLNLLDVEERKEEEFKHENPKEERNTSSYEKGLEYVEVAPKQQGARFLQHRHSHFPQGKFSQPDFGLEHNFRTPTK